ncbi:hypothetical protein [Planctomyces sp. SH-PL14]|uniref:hypothetical protein n=1 Tax=Planctomyces sp. SH-PL14 TaxID=1632864 RepID=UPI00078E1513|nr:hypothetical protein [Planctomyces sp. SH-PL14]AMV16834.1 hypothetical protein VT03_03020 [Planctomyces sp. SH-PL14]
MKKMIALAAAALVSVSYFAQAADKAECLEVGSKVGAFYVTDVTGPEAGKKLCYRCKYGSRPVVTIFSRQMDDQVASLVKQVDGVVGANQDKSMAAFVVLLSDKPEEAAGSLKKAADSTGIKHTPLTTFDGQAGPEGYKIAKEADTTVMMWVNGELKINETYKAGKLDSATVSKLVKDTGSILN